MTGNEARRVFLDFFAAHGHKVVSSSSLVPQDDPTLLFTNAGMVQFKRSFLGEEKRDYTRASTSQKCVRAGGKHNDLENVGYTARHHTFFEMLGNFSFGDYFKKEAIELAWDLVTNVYGLPKEKLWISVFREDDEAAALWAKCAGVPESRIVRMGEKDNFWAMGDTGPCGPCSEIHIDRGEAFGCGKPDCAVGCECDRFLEIWNLVFMQFERSASGKMTPLPRPSIDTGMGLERIASVMQNARTNYETDLFLPIIGRIEELSGAKLGASRESDVCLKVIADHSRAAAFLISDGVLPSNEGRGYVLRRIMRRAIRYGRQLGLEKPFLSETAHVVSRVMAGPYPELAEAMPFVTNVIANEEVRFLETLDNGLRVLNDTLAEMEAKGQDTIPGPVIFKLYDTFGFPVDIITDVVREKNIRLDMQGFDKAMDAQKARSRSVSEFAGAGEALKTLTSRGVKTRFTGYGSLAGESGVLLIAKDDREAPSAGRGDTVELVTESTPFYGEAGGQAGDTGRISGPGFAMEITGTKKDPTGIIIHKGTVVSGQVSKGQTVVLEVNPALRSATAANHSATHLLHAALRKIVGPHVKQAGSLVSADRLRFDFTHFSALTGGEKAAIQDLVNEKIRENLPVGVEEMDAESGRATGAMALFEEKYGDRVRVVSVGDYSKELCGGTHASRTGDIGLFLIVSEESVAAGVRRIEAVTGAGALARVNALAGTVDTLAGLLKEKPDLLAAKAEKLLAQLKQKEKELAALQARMSAQASEAAEAEIRVVNGVKVLAKKVEAPDPAALRDAADRFKDKIGSGVVVLGAVAGGKVLLVAAVTKDLVKKHHAGNLVKKVAQLVGGGGGGRPDMAQAGGTEPDKLDAALEQVYEMV